MTTTIDIHAHHYPRRWVELLERKGPAIGAQIGRNPKGNVTFGVPQYKAAFQDSYIDLPSRLKMMDDARVDVHALSLTQPMVYWAPPEFGLELAQVYNDGLAEAHLASSDWRHCPCRRPNWRSRKCDVRRRCPASAAYTWPPT